MDLLDGATAALKAFQLQQDKAEQNYQTFGARVVEEITDDLMYGRSITSIRGIKVDLAFILDGEGFISDDEAAKLVTGHTHERQDLIDAIEARAKELVKRWVDDSDIAQAVIAERIRDRVMEAES